MPPPLPHPCNNITEGAEQQAAGHGQAAPAAERPARTLVWANSRAGATHAEINSAAEAVVKGRCVGGTGTGKEGDQGEDRALGEQVVGRGASGGESDPAKP